jgi:hypothetical protein
MNHVSRLVAWSALSLGVLPTGCATDAPPTPRSPPKSVPGLSVRVDCGDCLVRPNVPALIRGSYAAAADKAGVSIASDTQITLTIKDYTERSPGMRTVSFIAGPLALALKDEIKAVALVDGKPVPLEYHYRIPFLGIETVAQKLGALSFEAVIR